MTPFQKVIKYLALSFAVFLSIGIIGGLIGVFAMFGGYFTGDAVTDDMMSYTVSSDVSSLNIKINAASLTIKQGDEFAVESNLKYLTVKEQNDVLIIKESKKFGSTHSGASLTLYIPDKTVFKNAEIKTGAGKFTVDTLSAYTIEFEFGAGDVKICDMTVSDKADIDGGAGKITISGGSIRDLDFDMGVGQLDLTSALTGKSEFDLGVGETNINVIGSKDDYKLDIEKGLGSITVDGKSFSGIKNSGNGPNKLEIDSGVGAINVKFETSNK
ncbi:MAG: DUF4097 family beta strand repeat-containing protein [Clostridia bacterium]|nr:DUF4097 family beta strand repeat-containing protein [Clostridia bacterium]